MKATLVIVILLALSLAACGGEEEPVVTNLETGDTMPLDEAAGYASDAEIAEFCRSYDEASETWGDTIGDDDWGKLFANGQVITTLVAKHNISEADAEAILSVWVERCP